MNLTSEIAKRKYELSNRYINYLDVREDLQKESYNLVAKSKELESSNLGAGSICTECRFNNCNECTGGGGPITDPGVWDGEEGGGGASCRDACMNIKIYKGIEAENEMIASWSAVCPGFAYQAGQWSLLLGPEGPVLVGGGVMLTCAVGVYYHYRNALNIIENEYVVCTYGCK